MSSNRYISHGVARRLSYAVIMLARFTPAVAHSLLGYAYPTRDESLAVHMLTKRAAAHDPSFIVQACLIPVLVVLSGIFAGLTLGYMSLDETQLHVLSTSGSLKQQQYANQIMPIRKDGHLLLTTLLLANMIVNETLPVLSENVLGGGIQAVVISTVLIVIFSEIIPQSVCSRYGLVIGAKMAIPMRGLIYLLFIFAWPIAKILELVLGPHQGIVYRRAELKELINMHAAGQTIGGDLAGDTVAIVGGALDFEVKVVKDAMTPLDKIFSLDIETKLDYDTLARVVRSGHSRIPVFESVSNGDKKIRQCVGVLLVKQCVLLDPEDATPLRAIPLNTLPIVSYDEPLHGLLNRFQEGRSHMAMVSRVPRANEPTLARATSETNEVHDEVKESLTRRFLNKLGVGDDDDDDEKDVEKGNGEAHVGDKEKQRHLEQGMPSDAVLTPENAEKFIQGIEGEPLGLITLEDVLEELIGEEILDEFDLRGHEALPASMYVPEEAQRAVDNAAAKRQAATRLGGLRTAGRTRSTPRLVPPQGGPARRNSSPAHALPVSTGAAAVGQAIPPVVKEEPELEGGGGQTTTSPVEMAQAEQGQGQGAAARAKGRFKSVNPSAEVWKDGVVGSRERASRQNSQARLPPPEGANTL